MLTSQCKNHKAYYGQGREGGPGGMEVGGCGRGAGLEIILIGLGLPIATLSPPGRTPAALRWAATI